MSSGSLRWHAACQRASSALLSGLRTVKELPPVGRPGAWPQPGADARAAAAQPELLQSGKVNKATDIYRRACSQALRWHGFLCRTVPASFDPCGCGCNGSWRCMRKTGHRDSHVTLGPLPRTAGRRASEAARA